MQETKGSALKSMAQYICVALLLVFGVGIIVSKVATAGTQIEAPTQASRANVFKILSINNPKSGGTGFLVNVPNYGKFIVTNRHVCEIDNLETKYLIVANEESGTIYTARRRSISNLTDLCIVYAPSEVLGSLDGLELADREARPNELTLVMGHPYLKPLTVYSGHLVNTIVQPYDLNEDPPTKFMRMGRLSFMVFPGNSGSPVLNADGKVTGVVFAMEGWTRNGLYIPLLDLKYFIISGGSL